jgi:xylan 1,4-beta-xylosidase
MRNDRNILLFALLLLLGFGCTQNSKKENTSENGSFQNPVLGGDYPDPSVVRVGSDYYLTHSSFEYYPGLLVWHSTDLINWQPIAHALNEYVGSVWAPDLICHNNKYYIYFPAGGTNWVVTADSPEGPWSAPIDLQLRGFIDPGHVVDEAGKRHLYLSKGYMVPLTNDGLALAGEPVFNYEGWVFPVEWSTECFCLESPKSTFRNGYFYLTSAEGGTAGPATSHMVVSARSNSPYGPWENSPYNPIVHTESRAERWWSQGHGTLVDDVAGNWWILYHGYEKGFHTLGRQMLMLPVEWTADDWFRIPNGIHSSDTMVAPAGKPSLNETSLSDNFEDDQMSLQWQFFKLFEPERVSNRNGKLHFEAKGKSFDESSPLLVNACDRKYEIQVEFELADEKATAGLCLFYNEKANVRIAANTKEFTVFIQASAKIRVPNTIGKQGYLRILNDENEVSFYVSSDGKAWKRIERSLDATGYNHNVFHGFLSLRAGLYAFGEGIVTFDNFIYNKL